MQNLQPSNLNLTVGSAILRLQKSYLLSPNGHYFYYLFIYFFCIEVVHVESFRTQPVLVCIDDDRWGLLNVMEIGLTNEFRSFFLLVYLWQRRVNFKLNGLVNNGYLLEESKATAVLGLGTTNILQFLLIRLFIYR